MRIADIHSFYPRLNTYGLILLGFAIPISNALTNIVLAFLFIAFIVLANKAQFWQIIQKNTVALLALALFLLIIIGVTYTPATLPEALDMLAKYRELLFIPLFIFLFHISQSQIKSLIAFISAMLLTLFISILMNLGLEQLGKGTADNAFVFKNHITQGIFMALAAYFLLVYALQSQHKWRWLLFILAALASINLLLMTEGRSGYLVFGSLSLLLIYQHWRWRGLLLISGLLLLMGSVLLTQFNIVQRYSEHVMQDIRAYDAGERVNSNALRYDFLRNGVQIAAQAPFFGHGTGSFAMVYRTHIVTHTQHQHFSHNPHNEYLMISIQWGGLGLLGWLLLLLFMWRNSLRLPPMWQWQAQAFVLTFVIGSLVNSLLLDSTEGHLFAFLAALFCTLPSQQVHTNAKKSASGNNHHTTYAEKTG